MNESFQNSSDGKIYNPDSPRWLEIMTAMWLCILLLFGIVLNGTTLAVFICSRMISASNNIPIAALLVNNLAALVFGYPLAIVAEISRGWLVLLNMASCVYSSYLVFLFSLSSMYLLAWISLSRWFVIVRPTTYGNGMTVKVTLRIMSLCYGLAFLITSMPMLGFGTYGLEEHETSCGLAWGDTSEGNKAFVILNLTFCLGMPILIMVVCYGSIYHAVKRAAVATDTQTTSRNIAQRKRESHLLKTCVIIVVVFVLSWTPYAVVSFYQAFGPGHRLSPVLTRIPAVVAKSSVLWDPIIYALNTSGFRQKVRKMFGFGHVETPEAGQSVCDDAVKHVSTQAVNTFHQSVRQSTL